MVQLWAHATGADSPAEQAPAYMNVNIARLAVRPPDDRQRVLTETSPVHATWLQDVAAEVARTKRLARSCAESGQLGLLLRLVWLQVAPVYELDVLRQLSGRTIDARTLPLTNAVISHANGDHKAAQGLSSRAAALLRREAGELWKAEQLDGFSESLRYSPTARPARKPSAASMPRSEGARMRAEHGDAWWHGGQ